jgi:peroxiredoxin
MTGMTRRINAPQLNERLEEQAAKAPPGVIDRIKAAQDEVTEAGTAPGLEIGDVAPNFVLPDATGKPVSLYERLEKGPVILSFYRGEWCPYCNLELKALQEILPDLRKQAASLIAVSPQTPDDAMTLSEKQNLEFDVVSDADQHVIRDYRVRYHVPDAVQEISLQVMKTDVSEKNADRSWNLPVPATFIIDTDRVIRAHHVSTHYMDSRMEPSEILEALEEIGAEGRDQGDEE